MIIRRITDVDYIICRNQGNIYKQMAKDGYDVKEFSDLYLHSEFCERAFDTIYSRFQMADRLECLDFILPEIAPVPKNKDGYFDEDVAYWIGFFYRQLYVETKVPSKELADLISFETMCRYYPGLHTVDEEMAIDIVCENFGLKLDMESMAENKKLETEAMLKYQEESLERE